MYTYKYQTKDQDKNVEITFLIPPNTNLKKFVAINITKDTISVYDNRQAQPVILGKLYDQIKDSTFHKLEVVKNGENYGEVTISLEKKNRNNYWPLLIISSKSDTYQSQLIDDQSEFLLSILNKTKDPQLAIQCLLGSAEKGNENAMFDLASHYSGVAAWKHGLQTSELHIDVDHNKAIKYFERFLIVYPGHYLALYRVGYLLKNLESRKPDDLLKSKQYLMQSFQRNMGYPDASLAIAQIFLEEDNELSANTYYKYALIGGLSDPKLDLLVEKFKKEEEEKKRLEEEQKKKEAEEKRKREEEEENQRLLKIKELERQTFYNYLGGAVVIAGIVTGVGIYMHSKSNK